MASKIDIASNALLLLGDTPIASFDEAGAGPQSVANLYELNYLRCVQSHLWGFSRKQQDLSQNVVAPLFGYQYSYALPADMLKATYLESQLDYQIYQTTLYTNDSSAQLDYMTRPDEGIIPAYFEDYVTNSLAAMVSIAVTDRATLIDRMENRAISSFRHASAIDSQSDTNIAIKDNPLIDVRG